MIPNTRETSLRIGRRYATRNMVHEVRVWRSAKPFDLDAAEPDATLLYEGFARLYSIAAGGTVDDGELVYMSSSYVSLPWEVDNTQVDDLIEMVKAEDIAASGRWFRVLNIDGGGELPVVRRHTVTSVQRSRTNPNPRPGGQVSPF